MSDLPVVPNPLVRLAHALPRGLPPRASLLAGLVGSAAAFWVAGSQSYAGTRLFASFVVAGALLGCAPLGGRVTDRSRWLGAGVLFFGGALLTHLTAGWLMAGCGALAALAAAVDEQQRGRTTRLLYFFVGFGLVVAAVIAIVLLVER